MFWWHHQQPHLTQQSYLDPWPYYPSIPPPKVHVDHLDDNGRSYNAMSPGDNYYTPSHVNGNGVKRVLHNNGMSLFQDLKLKRRKVDSRCSSDGESIGTSDSGASLSPDAQTQGEGSPKDKDRCFTPEEIGPPLEKNGFPSDAFIFMIKAERERVLKEQTVLKVHTPPPSTGVIKLTPTSIPLRSTPTLETNNNHHGHPYVLIKSEPRHDDDKPTHCRDPTPDRLLQYGSHLGQRSRNSPLLYSSRPHSSGGSDNESTGSRSSGQSEKKLIVDEDIMCCGGGSSLSPPPLLSRLSPPGRSSSSSTSGVVLSPHSPSGSSSSVIFTPAQHRISPNTSSVPSPPNHHLGLHQHQLLSTQSHLHTRLTSGPSAGLKNGTTPSTPMSSADLRSMVEKGDPLSVATSTSLSFHSNSMYRINGVRPEVISGGAVTNGGITNGHLGTKKSPTHHPTSSRSPNSGSPQGNSSGIMRSPGNGPGGNLALPVSSTGGNNHHHVNLNRTPTVIMGEAGGVRTMIWSQADSGIGQPVTNGNTSPPSHYPQQPLNNGKNGGGQGSPPQNPKTGLSMERLWASEALNLSSNGPGGSSNSINHKSYLGPSGSPPGHFQGHLITNSTLPDEDDYEQPMICMICEDRATGLHYGIITCEGCKGFFKRTVQNRRSYTCVADGTCEITKAQRNRCQYCRFKKCIEQGMVLQAVREDRMPGGRNSGAVYNLYKVPVKYRKHKKGNRLGCSVGGKGDKQMATSPPNGNLNCNSISSNSNGGTNNLVGPSPISQVTSHPSSVLSGTILKAALTSPGDVNHLRQASITFEQAAGMISDLVQCDDFHDLAALQNWEELLEGGGDISEKLCQMGDSIVYRLVQWTKRLPFYQEVPREVHTRILTHKWHELLVLTTSAWQAMHTPATPTNMSPEEETMENIQVLQRCLQAMMGRSLTLDQLRQDVGQMVEHLTYLTRSFRRLGIRLEEYVTLKVIAMLQSTGTKSNEVVLIQERYIKCLRAFLEVTCPSHPNRLTELLRTLPDVQAAASLLLDSKMFYVPFLLNSALLQR